MASSASFIKKVTRKAVSLFKRATTAASRISTEREKGACRRRTVLRKRILNGDISTTTTIQTKTKLTIANGSVEYPAPLRIIKDPFISMAKPEVEMLQLLREQAMSQKIEPLPTKLGEMHEALGSHSVGLGISCRNTIDFDDELFFPVPPSMDFEGAHLASEGSVRPESIDSCAAVRDLCVSAQEMDVALMDDDRSRCPSIASNQAVHNLPVPVTPSYHLKSDGSIAAESIASTSAVRNFQISTPPLPRCKIMGASPADSARYVDVFSPTWCEGHSWAIDDLAGVDAMAYKIGWYERMRPGLREEFDVAHRKRGGICVA